MTVFLILASCFAVVVIMVLLNIGRNVRTKEGWASENSERIFDWSSFDYPVVPESEDEKRKRIQGQRQELRRKLGRDNGER